jgi:hypothetical protein
MYKLTVFLTATLLSLAGCGGMESWIHKDVNSSFTENKFSKQELAADLAYLKKHMAERHPAYPEFIDQQAIDNKYAFIESQLKDGMTRQEFFRSAGKINPLFNDGHSFIFPLLAETSFDKKSGHKMFPFKLTVNGGRLYLEHSYARKSDPIRLDKGTEIISINGVFSSDLLNELQSYSHGETEELRKHMGTLLFSYWLNALWDFKDHFHLRIKTQQQQMSLELTPLDQWEITDGQVQDNWFRVLPQNIAYLRLGTFDVAPASADYSELIQTSFTEIAEKRIDKLIIDVRGNTGGQTDAGAEVISYLTNTTVHQSAKATEKLTQETNGLFGYKGKPGETIELDVLNAESIKPADKHLQFGGKAVVLINEMTYSAGIVFATTVQDHQLATLMGQATGGHANQTGNLVPFYLPNTKLLVLAPSRYIIRASGSHKKQPVQPDIPTDYQAASEQDHTLLAASVLLQQK